MEMRSVSLIFAFIVVLFYGATPTFAQEPFYKGKAIRIIVGTSAGGGFDTYTRTLARHFGKHVPGQPAIVVENMAGAGHLIAANHMYKVAKPDGLTIGHFHGGWFLYQLFKRPGIEFDATQFELIGSPIKESRACAFTTACISSSWPPCWLHSRPTTWDCYGCRWRQRHSPRFCL